MVKMKKLFFIDVSLFQLFSFYIVVYAVKRSSKRYKNARFRLKKKYKKRKRKHTKQKKIPDIVLHVWCAFVSVYKRRLLLLLFSSLFTYKYMFNVLMYMLLLCYTEKTQRIIPSSCVRLLLALCTYFEDKKYKITNAFIYFGRLALVKQSRIVNI